MIDFSFQIKILLLKMYKIVKIKGFFNVFCSKLQAFPYFVAILYTVQIFPELNFL